MYFAGSVGTAVAIPNNWGFIMWIADLAHQNIQGPNYLSVRTLSHRFLVEGGGQSSSPWPWWELWESRQNSPSPGRERKTEESVSSGVSRLVKLPGHLVDPAVTWEFETPSRNPMKKILFTFVTVIYLTAKTSGLLTHNVGMLPISGMHTCTIFSHDGSQNNSVNRSNNN